MPQMVAQMVTGRRRRRRLQMVLLLLVLLVVVQMMAATQPGCRRTGRRDARIRTALVHLAVHLLVVIEHHVAEAERRGRSGRLRRHR